MLDQAIVTLDDLNGVVNLYKHDFNLNTYSSYILSEFLTSKLLIKVRNELIGRV
jgi:hypothetical protein